MSTAVRWSSEKTAAWLTGVVAAAEPDPVKAELFRNMARAAEEQAAILAASLDDQDKTFEPSLRAKIVAKLVTVLGPRPMRPSPRGDESPRRVCLLRVRGGHRTRHADDSRGHRAAPFRRRWGHVASRRLRHQRRPGLEHLSRHGCGGRGSRAEDDPALGRGRVACGRLLHGRRRVHLDAVATRDV